MGVIQWLVRVWSLHQITGKEIHEDNLSQSTCFVLFFPHFYVTLFCVTGKKPCHSCLPSVWREPLQRRADRDQDLWNHTRLPSVGGMWRQVSLSIRLEIKLCSLQQSHRIEQRSMSCLSLDPQGSVSASLWCVTEIRTVRKTDRTSASVRFKNGFCAPKVVYRLKSKRSDKGRWLILTWTYQYISRYCNAFQRDAFGAPVGLTWCRRSGGPMSSTRGALGANVAPFTAVVTTASTDCLLVPSSTALWLVQLQRNIETHLCLLILQRYSVEFWLFINTVLFTSNIYSTFTAKAQYVLSRRGLVNAMAFWSWCVHALTCGFRYSDRINRYRLHVHSWCKGSKCGGITILLLFPPLKNIIRNFYASKDLKAPQYVVWLNQIVT